MSRPLLLSFLLPLLALAQDSSSGSELPPAGYNGGNDNPQDPSDAGAAGSQKGAFSLSGGAIAAIIVVAVLVVLGSSTFYRPYPKIHALTSLSRLGSALVARKEAPMGRSSIHPPCLSPLHWPLHCRHGQAEPPEPKNRHQTQLAAPRQERQQGARYREGPSSVQQDAADYNYNHERDEVKL
jgi:hypothetical protein